MLQAARAAQQEKSDRDEELLVLCGVFYINDIAQQLVFVSRAFMHPYPARYAGLNADTAELRN